MTVNDPPSKVIELTGQVAEKEESIKSTLNIQIERPTINDTLPVELNSPNEEKHAVTKRKGILNNPFAKHSPKKETTEDTVSTSDTATRKPTDNERKLSTSANGETKIAKGIGKLYTRLNVGLYYYMVNTKAITKQIILM